MTRTKKIRLHIEKKEAVVVAEINRRTLKARKDWIPRHPHQAAPMAMAAVVAVQHSPAALEKIRHSKRTTTRAPT
jgi:hypothetical protein